MKRILAVPTIAMIASAAVTLSVPPAKRFSDPDLARLIIVHLPCAITTAGLILLSAYFGWRYLKTHDLAWDVRNAATIEIGALFGVLTMLTGMLFSKVQWGTWWQWDPRQTSFLMVLLLFAAGLALRGAYSDERRRAISSSGYSVVGFVPSVFLIFVFPRLPKFKQMSFHPSDSVSSGGFDRYYTTGLIVVGVLVLWLCIVTYRARVHAGLLELRLEESNEGMADGGTRAGVTGVVQPVSVPPGSSGSDRQS